MHQDGPIQVFIENVQKIAKGNAIRGAQPYINFQKNRPPYSFGRLLLIIQILYLSLMTAASPAFPQDAPTTISLSYVVRQNFVAPISKEDVDVPVSAIVVLSGSNNVRQRWTVNNDSNYYNNSDTLGGVWKVISKDTIQASWTAKNFKKYVIIHVNGKHCTVIFKPVLNPGERSFITYVNGVEYKYTNPRTVSSTCAIQ